MLGCIRLAHLSLSTIYDSSFRKTDDTKSDDDDHITETIVTDHRVDGVPTLVLANKQDCEGAIQVEEIKQMFNKLIVEKLNVSEGNVMPISALRG